MGYSKKSVRNRRQSSIESKEDTEQLSKIIEEIEMALKAVEEIKTDFIQENVETEQYMFMFRLFTVRERGFALIEDYQNQITILKAMDDSQNPIEILLIQGTPLHIREYIWEGSEFMEGLFGK